jgi:hypothetical protein
MTFVKCSNDQEHYIINSSSGLLKIAHTIQGIYIYIIMITKFLLAR